MVNGDLAGLIMRILILMLMAGLGFGCAREEPAESASLGATVELTRDAADVWTAHFELPEAGPAWVFSRSALGRMSERPWRPDSWRITTPGVRLVREGDRDVLIAEDNAPFDAFDIEITPYVDPLIADYIPFMKFSDGGMAAFTGQFVLGPADMEAAANGEDPLGEVLEMSFVFKGAPGDSIVVNGETYDGRATYAGVETYVYFGADRPIETDHLALLLDGEIPEWILTELRGFLPVLMTYFADGMEAALPARPTVYAVWGGAERDGYSQSGSVLPGFLVASFSGKGLLEPDPGALNRLRRFYAHEAAHFWNGWTAEPREQAEAWVHEGAADALAIYAMSALVDDYDREQQILGQLETCEKSGAGGALNEAAVEGRFGDVYSCGSLAHFLAEAALAKAGKTPFDLWAAVIRRAKADGGSYDMTLWLEELSALSGDAPLAALLRRYAEEGLPPEDFEMSVAAPVREMAGR